MTSEPAPPTQPQPPAYPLDFGSMRNMVEYRFTLLDGYVDVNGLATFIVAEEPMKDKFRELLGDLANHNLIAKIRRVQDKLAISIFPKPHLGKPRRIINLLLFLATIATVSIAAFTLIFEEDPRLTSALYAGSNLSLQVSVLALAIFGIVGVHETGHLVAVRHHKMDATLPYFLPLPPPFPLGTMGAVISLRGPPSNRDQLFDLGFSGPFAGFLATIIVAIFAYLSAPLISEQEASVLTAAKLLTPSAWPNIPLLFYVMDQIGFKSVPTGHVMVLAQFAFAAEFGALLTFLNILPIWQLDGGHIARAVLGNKGHKLTALVGFGVLFVSGYYFFAIFLAVLMFASRRPLEGLEPLDDVSPLTNTRRALFALALVMLVLSFVIIF